MWVKYIFTQTWVIFTKI